MASNRQRRPYTGFGKELRRLMWDRNIHSWTQLEEIIFERTGCRYIHQSLSKYAAGSVKIPVEFVQDFSDALELSDKERTDLAEQLAYHSLPDERSQTSA